MRSLCCEDDYAILHFIALSAAAGHNKIIGPSRQRWLPTPALRGSNLAITLHLEPRALGTVMTGHG